MRAFCQIAFLAVFLCAGGPPAFAMDVNVDQPNLAPVRGAIQAERFEAAVAMLRPIVANHPDDADALNLMGFSLRKSGDYETALDFYLRALEIEPEHLGANEYLGELYVETGRLELAVERLEVLRVACGPDCEEYRELAEVIDTARVAAGL